jgi:hypothetical protein
MNSGLRHAQSLPVGRERQAEAWHVAGRIYCAGNLLEGLLTEMEQRGNRDVNDQESCLVAAVRCGF